MNIVLSFIYMDFLQTDKWLSPLLENDTDESGNAIEDDCLNQYFEQSGFQSAFTFKNLGSTLVFSLLLVVLFAL